MIYESNESFSQALKENGIGRVIVPKLAEMFEETTERAKADDGISSKIESRRRASHEGAIQQQRDFIVPLDNLGT